AVPEQVVMELGGWRTRAIFARYNVTSERDLRDAIERVSDYVAEHAADVPKIRSLHGEPPQNRHNRVSGEPSRKVGTPIKRQSTRSAAWPTSSRKKRPCCAAHGTGRDTQQPRARSATLPPVFTAPRPPPWAWRAPAAVAPTSES